MVTVSHMVKSIVKERPFLEEGLRQKIISYGNLAEQLKPEIDSVMDKSIKHSAIVMALRRYADSLSKLDSILHSFNYKNSELFMKTNIIDLNIAKSPDSFLKIKKLYTLVKYENGDVLNIIIGNNQISIITNARYKEKVFEIMAGEKIIHQKDNLVALTLVLSKEFIATPGVIFTIVRLLAWENINIYEIVSTVNELTFILDRKDSTKAYNSLSKVIE